MWWKIYFWLTIVLLCFSLLIFLAPSGMHIPQLIVMFLTYCVALVGLYTYIFKRSILPSKFWHYYFWIYVFIDLLDLMIGFVPVSYLKYISFLLVSDKISLHGQLVDTIPDIPLLYALYQLSKDKLYEPRQKKKKKNARFQWGMIQMALWGYASILTLFFFVLAFLPQTGTDNTKASFDPFFTLLFAPLLIFWLWVIIKFKEYTWNWWRTTLVANALLYSGSIIFGLLFPQPATGSAGFDLISVLQLFILLISFYVFGRDQFSRVNKKAS